MAKRKDEDEMWDRFWARGPKSLRKALAHLAIDLDTTAEKLAGMILLDAVTKSQGDAESLRKLVSQFRPSTK